MPSCPLGHEKDGRDEVMRVGGLNGELTAVFPFPKAEARLEGDPGQHEGPGRGAPVRCRVTVHLRDAAVGQVQKGR